LPHALGVIGQRHAVLRLLQFRYGPDAGKTAEQINKKREAEKRSEQRARFMASPQGKIVAYGRCVREQKKALEAGDETLAVPP
jgi:hypothetical protein